MRKKISKRNIDLGPRCNHVRRGESPKPVLFSRGRKSESFFTEDSKLYITPKEQKLISQGIKLDRSVGKWESASSRIVNDFKRYNPSSVSLLVSVFEKRYAELQESAAQTSQTILGQFSVVRLWNMSIVGAILFGMVTMTFVYRYLGQGASAREANLIAVEQQVQDLNNTPKVLGAEISKDEAKKSPAEIKTDEKKKLEADIREMVKGKPIEKMVPYIVKYDRTVAAFMIAIARKESGWGEHVPVLDGQDCYNYWGYRGQRELMGSGGHTCFNSPKDAVDTVAKRIDDLVSNSGRNTASKMVIWKCGQSCAATGGQAAANKWISDVDSVYKKLKKE